MNDAYSGIAYTDEDVRAVTDQNGVRLQTIARSSADICRDTGQVLADGKVVGWFQGRSEFGPRALGNRSILADPRSADMKDRLNARVKFRQAFRPFAPIVLAERAGEIFEGDEESPFMLLAKRIRPEWRDRIAAVVHVDGTARVQTVRRESNERLHALLDAFARLTGVPVLLNTSFNIKGEPIVETPHDAMQCFLGTGLDFLALHDMLIAKSRLHRFIGPLAKAYGEIGMMVRTGLSVEPSRSRAP
jgi:carbamoyltransferase